MDDKRAGGVGNVEAKVAGLEVEVASLNRFLAEVDRRYEQRFNAQEKAVNAALIAAEKAVNVAETNSEKWRMNANEWRGAMDDRERRFVMKDQLDTVIVSLQKEVDEVKEYKLSTEGRGIGLQAMWGYVMQIITLLGALGVGVFFGRK